MNTNLKDIEYHYGCACDIAMEEIESKARKILLNIDNDLSGYCQAMGTWFFSDEDGNLFDGEDTGLYPEIATIDSIMIEWDQYLHLTGNPLKLDWLNGEILKETDW